MPYPILLAAGAALTAAGVGAGVAANAAVRREQEGYRTAELTRQRGYQAEAAPVYQQSLQQSGRAASDAEAAQATAQRNADYAGVASGKGFGAAAPATERNDISGGGSGLAGERKRVSEQTAAWNNLVSEAQAELGGLNQRNFNRGIGNNRATGELGLIGARSRDSLAALQPEMEAAMHAGDAWKAAGMGLSAAGSLAGMAGVMGVGPSFGAAKAASAPLTAAQTAAFNAGAGPINPGAAQTWLALNRPIGFW